MSSKGIRTRSRKRKATDTCSEASDDITDKYINDILKNKNIIDDICASSTTTDVSTRVAKYEKLTKQIEEFTWIQCENIDCQKWRQIPNDIAKDIGDDSQWYCYMNSDSQYDSCAKKEEDYTAYDKLAKKLGYTYRMSQLTEGALVWAKMLGYCRWPGIVTKDPLSEFYVDLNGNGDPTHYHVEYLGKTHSHAWISASHITLYGHREEGNTKPAPKTNPGRGKQRGRKKAKTTQSTSAERTRYKETIVDDAIAEAEQLMLLSQENRLKEIKFNVKPKKHGNNASKDLQIKDEPFDFDDTDLPQLDNDRLKSNQSGKKQTKRGRKKKTEESTSKTLLSNSKSKTSISGAKSGKVNNPNISSSKRLNQSKAHQMQSDSRTGMNRSITYHMPPSGSKKTSVNVPDAQFTDEIKEEATDLYSEGELVLAKLDGYERWPALVTRDPETGLHLETEGNQLVSVHVEFLGPDRSHAWVKAGRVYMFTRENLNVKEKTGKSPKQTNRKSLTSPPTRGPSKVLKVKYEKSVEEAERMVALLRDERLRFCQFKYDTDDFHFKDSGFESYNYPASSGSSAASSAEKFALSRLNSSNTLEDKSKEEKFKLDVEMYKRNEKSFTHDLSRFMKRNGLRVTLVANWYHVQVGAFQLFLAVHERGGFNEVCKKKKWTAVFREVTETQYNAGPRAKNFYKRNIYPYELYVTGGDYQSEIRLLKGNKQPPPSEVPVQEDSSSPNKADEDDDDVDEDDLTAILEDLEEYSTLCQLEEDIEAEKKRMGINISYHDDSPYTKVSPGVKFFDTPSEFHPKSNQGSRRKPQEVPETMFSVSSGDSQNELIYHEMERIVNDDLL